MNPANGASINPNTAGAPNTNGTNDRVAVRMFNYAAGNNATNYPAPYVMWGNGAGGVTGLVAPFGETIWFENIRKPMVKYRTHPRTSPSMAPG
jgi:hypothetical protein